MTPHIDVAVVKSKWIMDESIYQFLCTDGMVVDRGIIYGGKEYKKFEGFSDSNIEPPKGMILEEILAELESAR